MTDFLSSLVCIAPLVALFVRGSRHEMFTPTPWTYPGYVSRCQLYVIRYAFAPGVAERLMGSRSVPEGFWGNSQVRR